MGSGTLRRAACALVVVAAVAAPMAGAGAAAAPTRDVSRFACAPGAPAAFDDLAGSVHAAAIRCAAAYGFVTGRTPQTFAPDQPVTRGQLASFVARALAFSGVELDTTATGFTDLRGSVHDPAINALARLGVLVGTSPTTFAPEQVVTRAQAATFIGKVLRLAQVLPEGPDAFVDDEGSVHEANIDALAAIGVVAGVTADRYGPGQLLSRGAAASLLVRTQDYAVELGVARLPGTGEVLRAALTGPAEVPGPGDPAGLGSASVVRASVPGVVCFTLDIDVALASNPVAAHVHRGGPDEAGPVVIPLPTPQVDEEGRAYQDGCVAGVATAVVDALYADPAGHYVNVHTAALPAGAIRGQLSTVGTALSTPLSGGEEAPGPGEAGARGDAVVDLLSDGTTVCASVEYAGAGAPRAAHIHRAAPGASGPIVVPLPPFDPDGPFSDGCVGGVARDLVAAIAADPGAFYVNVHTAQLPDGAVRGQLDRRVTLTAALTGAAEVPGPGDPDGTGSASVELLGDGRVCTELRVRGTDMPVAAHIHVGGPMVAGPVVITLPTPVFGAVSGCSEADPGVAAAVAADPDGYYVNVHTGAFPAGAVRGQLGS